MIVKGAHAVSFDLPFGFSHRQRGIRDDDHDAIGIELRLAVESKPKPSCKRNRTGGAPQPAQADEAASGIQENELQQHTRDFYAHTLKKLKQTVSFNDNACRPRNARGPVNALTHNVDNNLEHCIRDFWEKRGEEGANVQTEANHLRRLLFRKRKHPVPQDIWIPGASQPGEEQCVEAVVSEVYVLQQLQRVIQYRETWLEENGLPTNFQMRDKFERVDFLQWAKNLYHAEPHQLKRQKEDMDVGGKDKVKSGKKSRWTLEQQRRLGTHQLWLMVLNRI